MLFFPSPKCQRGELPPCSQSQKKVFRRKEKLHHLHFHADTVPAGRATLRFFALYREKRHRLQAGLPSLSPRHHHTEKLLFLVPLKSRNRSLAFPHYKILGDGYYLMCYDVCYCLFISIYLCRIESKKSGNQSWRLQSFIFASHYITRLRTNPSVTSREDYYCY